MTKSKLEQAVDRRNRFVGWAGVGVLVGFGALIAFVDAFHVEGDWGFLLGTGFMIAVIWTVLHERSLQQEINDLADNGPMA